MIVERGRIISRDGAYLRVVCDSQLGCERCAAGRGCGAGIFSGLLGNRLRSVRVRAMSGLAPGQTVFVGLRESALLASAALAYGLPLAGFFAGAVLGAALVSGHGGDIVGGAAGLAAGFAGARTLGYRIAGDARFEPVVVQCMESDEHGSGRD